jgi:hypothetical protein
MDFSKLTLKDLQENAPHLLAQHDETRSAEGQVAELMEQNRVLKEQIEQQQKVARYHSKKNAIIKKLREAQLPAALVTEPFVRSLVEAKTEARVDELIEDRVEMAEVAEQEVSARKSSIARSREQTLSESTGRHSSKDINLSNFVNGLKFGA